MPYYAIAKGKEVGVVTTWAECLEHTQGYSGAKFKSFDTREEADVFIFENMFSSCESDYYVYTDGSCINNGRVDAKAGIGIYFGENDPRNVSECVQGKQSNNTAELTAILKVYPIIRGDLEAGKKITIVSDSEYAIRCVTTYGQRCFKEGWKKPMPNLELVKQIFLLYKDLRGVNFLHVMAHTGKSDVHSLGNNGADLLANKAVGVEACPYAKIYLNVPFARKDEAKQLGAKWDASKKKWYVMENYSKKNELVALF